MQLVSLAVLDQVVLLEIQENKELLASLVVLDDKEQLEILGTPDQLGPRVAMDSQEDQELLVLLDSLDQLVSQVLLVPQEDLEDRVTRVLLVVLDSLDPQVPRANLDQLADRVVLDDQELLAFLDQLALLDSLDVREVQALTVSLVVQVHLVQLAPLDSQVAREQLGVQEVLGHQDPPVTRVQQVDRADKELLVVMEDLVQGDSQDRLALQDSLAVLVRGELQVAPDDQAPQAFRVPPVILVLLVQLVSLVDLVVQDL